MLEKYYVTSLDSVNFVRSVYHLPQNVIELFPLGGNIIRDDKYYDIRRTIRSYYAVSESQILIVQTGKLTERKKLISSLSAFVVNNNPSLLFIIAGSIDPDIFDLVQTYIASDARIKYIGWLSSNDLINLLCAADVYLQPGTQSVTMQQSLCCRCAVILDDVLSHHYYVKNNGWLIGRDGDLAEIFSQLTITGLPAMMNNSYDFASRFLDYQILSQRILK